MDTTYGLTDENIAVIVSLIATYLFIIAIVGLVLYVFQSLAFHRLAKNKNIELAWLAWVPIAQNYIFGKILDDKVPFGSKIIPYAPIILMVAPIAASLIAMIPYIGWIFPIASYVYYCLALYRLYKLYKPESAVLFLVFSVIFPIVVPFFIFAIRNKEATEYLQA